jgi:phosphoglycerol transferase
MNTVPLPIGPSAPVGKEVEEMPASSLIEKKNSFFAYSLALGVCLLILSWVMDLSRFDMRVPLAYHGDALFVGAQIKAIIDNGWYLHNAYVGMPGSLDMYDFPMADNVQFFMLKLLAFLFHDWAITGNVYFLLTFPLTTWTSLYVLRRFHISYLPALVASLLFTFLPYHFLRGFGHLFLAGYYMVPLITLFVLRLCLRPDFLTRLDPETGNPRLDVFSKKSLATLATCLVMAGTGIYYAFFGCYLLLVGALAASIKQRRLYPMIPGALVISTICAGCVLNVMPTLIHHATHSVNTAVAARSPAEAEVFSLKIAQLLLPRAGHRLEPLADWKKNYNSVMPPPNGKDFATLGMIGTIGFCALILCLLFKASSDRLSPVLETLSRLNAFAFLLATTGGLGSLFALTVSPSIRCYDRMSVFIAFFAFFAVSILAHRLCRRVPVTGKTRILMPLLGAAILLVGLLDVLPVIPVWRDEEMKRKDFALDSEYVQRLEAALPDGAMVFQLPYVHFPEGATEYSGCFYDHLRPYLHSHKLRWSFGAMHGRAADAWQAHLAGKPAPELIRDLTLIGFAAVYVDRTSMPRASAGFESTLSKFSGIPAIVSADERFACYDLSDYREKLRENYSAEQWLRMQEEARSPLLVSWQSGFSDLEGPPEHTWRWCCARKAEFCIRNLSNRPRDVTLSMEPHTGYAQISHLWITSPLFNDTLLMNQETHVRSWSFRVPPGEWNVTFASDAPQVVSPKDTRMLIFSIDRFALVESHP